jgi:UDP-glucose 4-epimerase
MQSLAGKKILVTGACGYIGSHTAIELLKSADCEVFSIDSLINSSAETTQRISQITGKSIKNYAVDICDMQALQAVFDAEGEVHGIIHFAALKSVPESVEKPFLYYRNNIDSLCNLLQIAAERHIVPFIFSSSCSIYGNVDILPVVEATEMKPAESPYAHTKQIGEQILQQTVQRFGYLRTIALRYFNPVGADASGLNGELPINPPTALLPVITQTAIGLRQGMSVFGTDYPTRDGTCIRDYVHVSDIARAHVLALAYLLEGKQTQAFDVYNLGTGDGVTVKEAISAFERITGKQLPVTYAERRAGDVVSIYSDSQKAKDKLGWEAALDINEMMRSAWAWQCYLAGK